MSHRNKKPVSRLILFFVLAFLAIGGTVADGKINFDARQATPQTTISKKQLDQELRDLESHNVNHLRNDGGVVLTPQTAGPVLPYNDPHPLICSRITATGHNINSTITYVVPKDWTMWGCLKERFPDWTDRDMMESINMFRFYANDNPSLRNQNPDDIPVGFTFIGGGDGAGPSPVQQEAT